MAQTPHIFVGEFGPRKTLKISVPDDVDLTQLAELSIRVRRAPLYDEPVTWPVTGVEAGPPKRVLRQPAEGDIPEGSHGDWPGEVVDSSDGTIKAKFILRVEDPLRR